MKITRSRYAENGKSPRWDEDEAKLCSMLREKGWTAGEIARRMNRTRDEVLGKLWRMKRRAV